MMGENDELSMKSKPGITQSSAASSETVQGHNFNVEAMVANNFGQGDDHTPSDPMNDPMLMGELLLHQPCQRTA